MPQLEDPKHESFAREYVVDFNGKQAAIRAGYSKKTAEQQASRLLRNVKISARVAELTQCRLEKIDPDRIVKELSCLSTSDISEALDVNGNPLPIHQIPERLRRCISGFEMVEEHDENGESTGHQVKKYKFYDKNVSLLGLAKVFKMLTDRVEVKQSVTLENFIGGTWPDEVDKKPDKKVDKK